MTDAALLDRLQKVEDKLEIYELKAAYCAACDDDHNPDTVITLFAQNSVWEAPGLITCNGPDELHAFFSTMGTPGGMRNSAHMVMNPQISVDGDEATGAWRFLMMWTGLLPDGGLQYVRIIGTYEDRFIKENGRWLFKSLHANIEENDAYPTQEIAVGGSSRESEE